MKYIVGIIVVLIIIFVGWFIYHEIQLQNARANLQQAVNASNEKFNEMQQAVQENQ